MTPPASQLAKTTDYPIGFLFGEPIFIRTADVHLALLASQHLDQLQARFRELGQMQTKEEMRSFCAPKRKPSLLRIIFGI